VLVEEIVDEDDVVVDVGIAVVGDVEVTVGVAIVVG
jgi:hypothetical protein